MIGSTTTTLSDDYSDSLATQTLRAVLPAWLAGGRSPQQLWKAAGNTIREMPPKTRLAILEAVLAALPQVMSHAAGPQTGYSVHRVFAAHIIMFCSIIDSELVLQSISKLMYLSGCSHSSHSLSGCKYFQWLGIPHQQEDMFCKTF